MADPSDKPGYSFDPGPPPEASRFLANKGMRPSFSWQDVEPEEHAVAFTVAKSTGFDILSDVRGALQEALDEGLPFAEFQKRLRPKLEEKGWWGKAEATDPLTGEVKPAQLGSPRRLKTIYRANLRTARAAGQWERIERTKHVMPYLQYNLGPSERHRPHHEAKAGLVLPVDDPFWDGWMPPNGWGCKCWVRQISPREAAELGVNESPVIDLVKKVNARTGEVRWVPDGVDPGWERNPGKLRLQAVEQLLEGKLAHMPQDMATAALKDMATSWRARRVLAEGAPGTVPVSVMPDDLGAVLETDARLVKLSAETVVKQQRSHADLTPEAYASLSELITRGKVLRVNPHKLMFIENVDELPAVAVIKVTADLSELFLVSFYKGMSRRYRSRIMERSVVVRD